MAHGAHAIDDSGAVHRAHRGTTPPLVIRCEDPNAGISLDVEKQSIRTLRSDLLTPDLRRPVGSGTENRAAESVLVARLAERVLQPGRPWWPPTA